MRATHRRSLRPALFAPICALGLLLAIGTPAFAAPEKPVTKPATGITEASATLNGELNPKASSTTGFFFTYNTNGTCTEGSETAHEAEATGKAIKVSALVEGLGPNTEYTVCVVATHGEEATSGAPVKFKTLAIAPSVGFESVSSETPFQAHLEGGVNPNNETSECHFEYGEASVTEHTVSCEPEELEGLGEQGVGATISSLTPGTTYHYLILAKNPTGETEGPEQEFTTLSLEPPVIDSEAAIEVGSRDARLEAKVNPNFQEATYQFEYSASEEALLEGKGTVVAGATTLPAVGEEQQAGPVDLAGQLSPGTTYFYRVVATNGTGPSAGPPQTFTTLAAIPTIGEGSVASVTRTTALLAAHVNPEGGETAYHFAYITRTAYDQAIGEGKEDPFALAKATPAAILSASDEPQSVTLEATDLNPGETYEFALVATNSAGTATGPASQLTAGAPTPPVATTGGVEGVGSFSATLTGTVNTEGLPTTLEIEIGTAPGSGSPHPASVRSSSGNTDTIAVTLSEDLQPGTTYYYRVVASGPDGTGFGSTQSFTTTGLPAVFPVVTLPPAVPFVPIAQLEPKPVKPTPVVKKPPTKAELLKKALKKCQRKPKKQRKSCQRQARKRYKKG